MDLQAVRDIASAIARDAGAVLMQTYGKAHTEKTKSSPVDIVTEADGAAEAVIVAGLTRHFPTHHIVGEEGGGMGAPAETAEYFWYVDPLDGTTNFASNIPFFSTSIGMADRNMRPLVGVVYDPFSDELYSAAEGLGATLNGKKLTVSSATTLQQSVLSSGFPYDYNNQPYNNLREWGMFCGLTRGMRRFGSAALELAYVASGRLDGYWERYLHPWDIQAGIVIVREAGGLVTDFEAQESRKAHEGERIIASNGHLHSEIMRILKETEG